MPTLTCTDPITNTNYAIPYGDCTPNQVGGQLEEHYAVDASKVTRVLQCPWGQRFAFIRGVLGFPFRYTALKGDGLSYCTIRRNMPLPYPFTNTDGDYYLFATSVTDLIGVGPRGGGVLLIHAAARRADPFDLWNFAAMLTPMDPARVVYSAILGAVSLTDIRDDGGEYAWLVRNPRPLARPFPCRGKLGLWTPPAGLALPDH